MINRYNNSKIKRQIRTRTGLTASTDRPRLSIFRSNKHISAQIIDDLKAVTLVNVSAQKLKVQGKTKLELAIIVGETIARQAKLKKITKIVFDRGPYKYHGRVKALADAARKAGLKF